MSLKKLVSVKLPTTVIEELKVVAERKGLAITSLVQEIFSTHRSKCPSCGRRWPKHLDNKISFTTRVDESVAEAVSPDEIPSRLYVALIEHAIGFCPVCHQRKPKVNK